MRKIFPVYLGLLTTVVVLYCIVRNASAQVVLKPAGQDGVPLRAKSLTAKVLVQKNRFATTDLDLVFQNEIYDRVEADFLYTVPEGAVVTDFAYFYGNERVPARIAEKERAAAIYKHITTRQRDPALVEMVGKNTFRARIFPVEPNADLRVQIRFVQVLDVDAKNRASLAVPLQTPKSVKWDSVSVTVRTTGLGGGRVGNNFGIPAKREGDATVLSFTGTNYRTDKNLRVSLAPPTQAQTPFLAAPSGGAGGFFAVAVSGPSGTRFDPDSVRASGVPVYALETRRLAANNLLICGRYRKGGVVRFVVRDKASGNTISTSPLTFSIASEPNNPATKFWAASRIGRLSELRSENGRAEVVALSKRFTLPSRWTSWIAIPVEERKLYEREKAEAEMGIVASALYRLKRQGRYNTTQAKRLLNQFEMLSIKSGYKPGNWERELQYRFGSLLYQEYWVTARAAADAIVVSGRETQAARDARERLVRVCELLNRTAYEKVSVHRSLRGALRDAADIYGARYAKLVADGDKPEAAKTARRYAMRACKALGINAHESLREHAETWANAFAAERSLGVHGERIGWHWFNEEPDYRYPHRKITPEQARSLQNRVVRLAKMMGRNPQEYFNNAEQDWTRLDLYRKRAAIIRTRKSSPPDKQAIRRLEQGFLADARSDRLRPVADYPRNYYGANTPDGREAFAKDRLARIAARVEADKLEADLKSPLKPVEVVALEARVATLRKTESELRARMGDPLLFVDAPRDARLVVAVLPNGEKMPLEWDDTAQRWQSRFDIPTYATEGDYIVAVEIVLADGSREAREFRYTVDVTAPTGTLTATRNGGDKTVRVEIVADADTHRAVAVLSDGGTVPLSVDPSRTGRFFGRLTEAGKSVTIVLTDRAHNRTTLTAAVTEEGAR